MPTVTMDVATQERWDAWARGWIAAGLKQFADEVVYGELIDLLGEELGKMLKRRDDEIKSLRDEVEALRADVEVVTKIQRGEIRTLKTDRKHASS